MSDLTWRKSTYTGGAEGQNCVELASQGAVRDSKNPDGPVLNIEITALLTAMKSGRIAG
ncbi:MAG TPA: DUF397 domain-containing protein [Pseudonocardiaceae bacterium]